MWPDPHGVAAYGYDVFCTKISIEANWIDPDACKVIQLGAVVVGVAAGVWAGGKAGLLRCCGRSCVFGVCLRGMAVCGGRVGVRVGVALVVVVGGCGSLVWLCWGGGGLTCCCGFGVGGGGL